MRIGLHLRLERASPDVPPDRANVATPLARLGFDPGVRLAEVRADADASVSLPRKEVALISTYVGHRNRRIDLVAWRHNYFAVVGWKLVLGLGQRQKTQWPPGLGKHTLSPESPVAGILWAHVLAVAVQRAPDHSCPTGQLSMEGLGKMSRGRNSRLASHILVERHHCWIAGSLERTGVPDHMGQTLEDASFRRTLTAWRSPVDRMIYCPAHILYSPLGRVCCPAVQMACDRRAEIHLGWTVEGRLASCCQSVFSRHGKLRAIHMVHPPTASRRRGGWYGQSGQ